jgi:hypothetical protein
MDPSVIDRTLSLLKDVQQPLALTKAGISTGLGIVAYDLEPSAKLLYPVLTPLRNTIPRVNAEPGAGLAAHWKQITGINTTGVRAGLSEGNRGAVISLAETDRLATYKALGLENSVTFEAELAARGFDDARALAGLTLLQSLMIQEEITILNGNSSMPLGQPAAPTLVAAPGGSLPVSATNYVAVAPMTYMGYVNPNNTLAGLQPIITRTNADGSVDTFGGGIGWVSPQSAAGATTAGNQAITATVAPVKGANAYAWFFGQTAGLANLMLAAITTSNTVTISTVPTSTYSAASTGLNADNSTCALDFDGLITQALQSTGYYASLNGATLTADTYGGCVEIDTMLKYFWDAYKITPSCLRVAGQVLRDITKKVLAGTTNPSWRINLKSEQTDQGTVIAGMMVSSYLNKYALGGTQRIPIELHPYMPEGMIFADLDIVPYPNANVSQARVIATRQEYYQVEWPLVTRKYQYGVYCDEVLKHYVPFGSGVIANIGPG